MAMCKKRKRNCNFSREETEKLISLVESRKHIIENKKSDATTWQDKEMAWKAIESEFNSSVVEIFRDAKHLKLKFEALKRDTRKKARFVSERYKFGGSTVPPLTPVEQKVKEIMLLSIEGEDTVYDSDQSVVAVAEENMLDSDVELEELNLQILPEITVKLEEEPSPNKICLEPGTDAVGSTSKEVPEVPEKKWGQWNTAFLKSKKHPALFVPVAEENMLDSDVELESSNVQIFPETVKLEDEPYPKKICLEPGTDAVASTSKEVPEVQGKKWGQWKPASLKSKKHPALCKMEMAKMQKKLIEEEIEEKKLRKQLLQEEIIQKNQLFLLEKQQMLLKIELLRIELHNKKQNNIIK